MSHLITAFEVPPEADQAFLGAWAHVRDARAPATTALHRALRPDVTLRYVEIARGEPADADVPAPPFPSHAAQYEVVHGHGEPEGAGGVLLIDPFAVPPDEDERFLPGWERVHAQFAARQGYLGVRLHRSAGPARFGFVAIVRWSSPLMFARALQQPDVDEAIAALPFPGQPALYIRTAV